MEPLVGNNTSALTCPSCNVTVTQSTGTKRTICPHCGNFYDPDKSSLITRNQNRNRGGENSKKKRPQPEPKRQTNHGRKSKTPDSEVSTEWTLMNCSVWYKNMQVTDCWLLSNWSINFFQVPSNCWFSCLRVRSCMEFFRIPHGWLHGLFLIGNVSTGVVTWVPLQCGTCD